jgi:hypothetical protein
MPELGTAVYTDNRIPLPDAVFDADILVRDAVVEFGTHPDQAGVILAADGYLMVAGEQYSWLGSATLDDEVLMLPPDYFRESDGDPFTLVDGVALVFRQPVNLVERRQCVM